MFCRSHDPNFTMLLFLLLTIAAAITSTGHLEPGGMNRTSCSESERRALLAIRSDMYGSGRWLSSWKGDDCCSWRGVACDSITGHVTRLDLRNPRREGGNDDEIRASKVNPSLLELKHLKHLDLSMNDFDGAQIPKMFASLVHLEYLNLSSTMFSGPISPQLGNLSSLHYLDLNNCDCTSAYDDSQACPRLQLSDLGWLSHIPSLEYLDMSCVDLSQATSWLQQINSVPLLQALQLGNAHLQRVSSPSPLFNLTSISVLDLSGCLNLSTTILTWLSNASSLEYLYLQECYLRLQREPLQLALGSLPHLKALNLSYCSMSGDISGIVRNVSRRLKRLDLSSNSLVGHIPPIFWELRHLEYLDLFNNMLSGRISETLGNLTSLQHLNLAKNEITREIPATIGNLIGLEFLRVSINHIVGKIPPVIGNLTNLVHLGMSSNNIGRHIPETLGNLIHLEVLGLCKNNISGKIPEALGNLKNLQMLQLCANSIHGQIPAAIGGLYNLSYLDISRNQLNGRIPRMAGLCNSWRLDLSHNNIGGELKDLFDGLLYGCPQGTQLLYLYLDSNNLSGTVPSSLAHLSQLRDLALSSNSLRGNITEAHFTELANLDVMFISNNSLNVMLPNDWNPPFNASTIIMNFCHIRGELPYWIQTQKRLIKLHLSRVGLSGDLPAWFSDFISEGALEELDLSSNNLTGHLPSTLKGILLMNLANNSFVGPIPFSIVSSNITRALILSDNYFSGTIPSTFCNLTSLGILDVSRNQISGEIPNCRDSFPNSLQSVHLNDNNLSGRLPSFLANCRDLVALDLGENKLYDEIPNGLGKNLSALKVLQLRSNILHGVIPINLANLTSLQVLDLSFNKLRGSIPALFGNFTSMIKIQKNTTFAQYEVCDSFHYCSITTSGGFYEDRIVITAKGSTNDYTKVLSLVTSMDLSNNNLFGEIPEELTNLLGLRFLSLSNNHLTGRIPENIGAIKQLESLDLSVNNLTGAIPSSLSALNFLDHLNLSYNNLSGRIPKGNQLQTFSDPSLFVGNKDLCGFPLAECPSDPSSSHAGDEESGDKLDTILEYTFIVAGFVAGFWVSLGTLIVRQSIRIALFRSIDKLYDRIYVQLAIRFAKHSEAQK